AGDDDGGGVRGAGTGHRAGGAWVAEGARDFRVAARLAARDRPQLLPHAALESRGFEVEGKLDRGRSWLLDPREDLRDPGPEVLVVAVEARGGELLAERREETVVVVAEGDHRDALVRRGHEQAPERGVDERVAEPEPAAAAAVGARRHPERRPFVRAAARAVAGLVGGVGHRSPALQLLAEAIAAHGLRVLARAQAHHRLERALQVVRADTRDLAQPLERG